jgi:hypothetical protein
MKINILRSSERCSGLEKNRNNVIREKINIKTKVLDYIRYTERPRAKNKLRNKKEIWNGVRLRKEEKEERKDLEICERSR